MEQENEECFPFWDLLIKRSSNSRISSAVYGKPTHLDRCLNFRSERPMQEEQSVVSTPFERDKKTFLHSSGPEQRDKVCETDSHVGWLPQMDYSKQKEEATQRMFRVDI